MRGISASCRSSSTKLEREAEVSSEQQVTNSVSPLRYMERGCNPNEHNCEEIKSLISSLLWNYNSSLVNISPLNTKRRLLHLKPQSVPRCKHFSSRLQKTNQFML